MGHAPVTPETSPIEDPSLLPTQMPIIASGEYDTVQLSRKSVLVQVFTLIGIEVPSILDIPNVLARFLESESTFAICHISGS